MSRVTALWIVTSALCVAAQASEPTEPSNATDWHRLVDILQYLEVDYPAARASGDAFELQEQRVFADEAKAQVSRLGPAAEPLKSRVAALAEAVRASAPADTVRREAGTLAALVSQAGKLQRAPRTPPDLKEGARVFADRCALCHGPTGDGRTPAGSALKPPPADFHAKEMASSLTPYRVFNTSRFGVPGTAMAPFPGLTDADRWAVGFYVLALRHPACKGSPPPVTLTDLANQTDAQLAARYGAGELPCLRHKLTRDDSLGSLAMARSGVDRARKWVGQGNATKAREALVDAYLNNVEPLEPAMRAQDPERVERIEAVFLHAREHADDPPRFKRDADELTTLLAERSKAARAASFSTVFWMALLVLVREGFEAFVVVGALLAVLKKMQQPEQARRVHVGWVSALVVGAILYAFGRTELAGANREWMEAIVAILAVGMLLYAALWLNARANMNRFMGELRGRVQGALGRGSALGLFFIAFSAVFREAFETALFLQGLSIDSKAGAAWGAAAGLAIMLGLVLLIGRIGFRLPMKPLFKASTVLLYATAVVLLGKGLHAFQEVGALPLAPIHLPSIEPLGIFPDAVTVVPQLLLAIAPLVARLASRDPDEPNVLPQVR